MFRLYSNENFPLPVVEELRAAGVRLVLYPLSAFRAMSKAAERVYQTLRNDGTQEALTESMQTPAELYDVRGYHAYENKLEKFVERVVEHGVYSSGSTTSTIIGNCGWSVTRVIR